MDESNENVSNQKSDEKKNSLRKSSRTKNSSDSRTERKRTSPEDKDDIEPKIDKTTKSNIDEKNESAISTISPANSNLKRPWLTYAMAVCQGLQSQLNSTNETISKFEPNETVDSDLLKQMKDNQKEIMDKVLNELNNLTKRAKKIEQSCLKPNEMKESTDKSKSNENDALSIQATSSSQEASETPPILVETLDQQSNEQTVSSLKESLSAIVQNEFKCSICQELMVNANSLNCSHTFCKICIDEWLDENQRCPVCRRFVKNNADNTQHVLPIDNFLQLYFAKFATPEQQSDRARLINDHRSREVIVIADETSPAQRNEQRDHSSIFDDDFFESIGISIVETPPQPRNRQRRRRQMNYRSRSSPILPPPAVFRRVRRGNRARTSNRQPTPIVTVTSHPPTTPIRPRRGTRFTQTDSTSMEVSPLNESRDEFPEIMFYEEMNDGEERATESFSNGLRNRSGNLAERPRRRNLSSSRNRATTTTRSESTYRNGILDQTNAASSNATGITRNSNFRSRRASIRNRRASTNNNRLRSSDTTRQSRGGRLSGADALESRIAERREKRRR